jgi:hemolysin activation/secretion protein
MQPLPRLLVVGHAAAGTQKNAAPGAEFDLGLGRGVRAFPSHSFTGDRAFVLNAESRWLLWPRLFGLVGVGVAAFADHAGAWFAGSARRTGTDAGVGLRLASIREAGSVWRVDWSRRAANDIVPAGWVVSIGRGFVF